MIKWNELQEIAGDATIREKEPMAAHTTFRIGGPADFYVEIAREETLQKLLRACDETQTPWFLLGNGSNLLVSDEGYRGVMISLAGMNTLDVEEAAEDPVRMTVGGGVSLSRAAAVAAQQGLEGLAFAGGIPGTIGGAVAMNAGAYGGEIKDVLTSARVMKSDGTVLEMPREALALSYRHSRIQEEDLIVLSAVFSLKRGDRAQIRAQMQEFGARRREKQPLEYGSAGSTFKRPEGYFAGKLIQDAGLKGYRCGDVMVSEKHSGFIVNVGHGTCREAMQVIRHVQETVYEMFGVRLELEVKVLRT